LAASAATPFMACMNALPQRRNVSRADVVYLSHD